MRCKWGDLRIVVRQLQIVLVLAGELEIQVSVGVDVGQYVL